MTIEALDEVLEILAGERIAAQIELEMCHEMKRTHPEKWARTNRIVDRQLQLEDATDVIQRLRDEAQKQLDKSTENAQQGSKEQ
jgi:hypothetical protein